MARNNFKSSTGLPLLDPLKTNLMAIKAMTSPTNSNTSLSHTLSNTETCSDFHDASFSSYISDSKSITVLNHVELKQDMPDAIHSIHSYQRSTQRITADREISIFSAEKYFNGGIDKENDEVTEMHEGKNQIMENDSMNPRSERVYFNPGFRSSCSETSRNSRSALLPGVPKSQSSSNKSGRCFLATFSWMCSCSNSNSVDVKETAGENKFSKNDRKNDGSSKRCVFRKNDPEAKIKQNVSGTANIMLQKADDFAFAVSNSVPANLTVGNHHEEESEENEPNTSEVFASPTLRKGEKARSLDKRLDMFAWDVKDVPAILASRIIQDDEGSDCSSDLFEINNLPENVHPFFKHQVSDGMSSSAATFYEPSEASIDWSVVTASAVNVPVTPKQESRKGHSTVFLGCKSHEAAKVAGEEYRISKKTDSNTPRHHRTVTLTMAES